MQVRRTVVEPSETIEFEIFRAFGGRVRLIERRPGRDARVIVINGFAGQVTVQGQPAPLPALQLETIKRRIRLYPRNFLAHAEEYDYTPPVADRDADGDPIWRLDLPAEDVSYGFDAAHFQCRFLEDRVTGERITYSDYVATDGILTGRREQCWQAGQLVYEDDIFYLAFNVPFDDADFTIL